jgi:VWFA-related protein
MRRALTCLVLAFSASALLGSDPPGTFSERVDVRLVQVDAWATAKGVPVLDLTQSELTLFEDGQPVQILYFEQPEAPAPATGAAPTPAIGARAQEEASMAPPPTVAIFLDDIHLGLAGRQRLLTALAAEFGGERFRGANLLIVAFDGRFSVVLPRTRDLLAARRALAAVAPPAMAATQAAVDELRVLAQIQERQRAGLERQTQNLPGRAGGLADESDAEPDSKDVPCSTELLRIAEDYAGNVEHDARSTLSVLTSFATSLSALPGRKILLFVSDGIPSRPGGVAYDYVRTLCDGSGARSGIQYAVDVTAHGGLSVIPGQLSASTLSMAGEDRLLGNEVHRATATANASGVTFWSYGARGLTGTDTGVTTGSRMQTPETQSRQRGELEDVMTSLAIDSGGRPMIERNDLSVVLASLASDLSTGYSLAYMSPRTGDGRVHQIRLETTRSGVELRFRRSWRDTSAAEELGWLVEGALSYGVDRPALDARVSLVRASLPGESTPRLLLRISIPEESLALQSAKNGARSGRLRVAIAIRPKGGVETPAKSKVLPIELPPPAAGQAAERIVRDVALPELPPGSVLAVGLRDEAGGASSVVRLAIGGS